MERYALFCVRSNVLVLSDTYHIINKHNPLLSLLAQEMSRIMQVPQANHWQVLRSIINLHRGVKNERNSFLNILSLDYYEYCN